jgi:sugar transferase (PEP-CTERM/EpsH1 system associated)
LRILFVAARFPYPPLNGDQVRAYHQLRTLSARHQITLLSPEPLSDDNVRTVRAFCEHIETVRTSRWRSLGRLAKGPFTSLPLQTLLFFDSAFAARANELISSRAIDLVHAQLVRMAPVVHALPGGVARVLDLIDALSVNMVRRAERSRGPLAWVAATESRRVLAYERDLPKRYDQLVISSASDRAVIGQYPNIHVVPNGVDVSQHGLVTNGRDPTAIVFTGTMWYFPNVDAARWLVGEILPLVRSEIPDARLFIVGARPVGAVKRLAKVPGVVVTGEVPKVHAFLAKAAVAVAPMRTGSGGQFKVIEAMASGTPVVATPLALGGCDAVSEQHLLVASDASSFAQQVVRLLRDRQLRERLANEAYDLVRLSYSWDGSVRKLESIYELALRRVSQREGMPDVAP